MEKTSQLKLSCLVVLLLTASSGINFKLVSPLLVLVSFLFLLLTGSNYININNFFVLIFCFLGTIENSSSIMLTPEIKQFLFRFIQSLRIRQRLRRRLWVRNSDLYWGLFIFCFLESIEKKKEITKICQVNWKLVASSNLIIGIKRWYPFYSKMLSNR